MSKQDAAVTYRVAESRLRDGKKPQEIIDLIKAEFSGLTLSREDVYKHLEIALKEGMVRLQPPIEKYLSEQLEAKFKCDKDSIRVVECPMPQSNEGTSFAAALWAVELVKEIAQHKKSAEVGVGLGPGSATLDFTQRFNRLLVEEKNSPKLNLVAITAGCPASQPQYSSVSYLNLFSPTLVEKRIGFFAETFMPAKEFDRLKQEGRIGITEAFKAKEMVQLVVTSMGGKDDPHALFRVFHEESGRLSGPARMRPKWWNSCVGDCQYRPYSAEAPIEEGPEDLRAATLFELQELVSMAKQKDKHVLLIARPCWHCRPEKTRAKALLPLLTSENLRVFSKLVVDSATARELLKSTPAEP